MKLFFFVLSALVLLVTFPKLFDAIKGLWEVEGEYAFGYAWSELKGVLIADIVALIVLSILVLM
jgi:hypothetical protein